MNSIYLLVVALCIVAYAEALGSVQCGNGDLVAYKKNSPKGYVVEGKYELDFYLNPYMAWSRVNYEFSGDAQNFRHVIGEDFSYFSVGKNITRLNPSKFASKVPQSSSPKTDNIIASSDLSAHGVFYSLVVENTVSNGRKQTLWAHEKKGKQWLHDNSVDPFPGFYNKFQCPTDETLNGFCDGQKTIVEADYDYYIGSGNYMFESAQAHSNCGWTVDYTGSANYTDLTVVAELHLGEHDQVKIKSEKAGEHFFNGPTDEIISVAEVGLKFTVTYVTQNEAGYGFSLMFDQAGSGCFAAHSTASCSLPDFANNICLYGNIFAEHSTLSTLPSFDYNTCCTSEWKKECAVMSDIFYYYYESAWNSTSLPAPNF